jgi:hypothetical protein
LNPPRGDCSRRVVLDEYYGDLSTVNVLGLKLSDLRIDDLEKMS